MLAYLLLVHEQFLQLTRHDRHACDRERTISAIEERSRFMQSTSSKLGRQAAAVNMEKCRRWPLVSLVFTWQKTADSSIIRHLDLVRLPESRSWKSRSPSLLQNASKIAFCWTIPSFCLDMDHTSQGISMFSEVYQHALVFTKGINKCLSGRFYHR